MRACHVERLAAGRRTHGIFATRFVLGRDGVARFVAIWGPRLGPEESYVLAEDPGRKLASCLTKAVREGPFPAPEAGIATVEAQIELVLPRALRTP
jgi:hypothetical protein